MGDRDWKDEQRSALIRLFDSASTAGRPQTKGLKLISIDWPRRTDASRTRC
jgi:hypothetical protein